MTAHCRKHCTRTDPDHWGRCVGVYGEHWVEQCPRCAEDDSYEVGRRQGMADVDQGADIAFRHGWDAGFAAGQAAEAERLASEYERQAQLKRTSAESWGLVTAARIARGEA